MQLPEPRGPVSGAIIHALRSADRSSVPSTVAPVGDPLRDDDLQVALWTCYELHYRGFDGVDDGWEWEPSLIAVRRRLEEDLLAALRRDVPLPPVTDGPVADRLWRLVEADDGPQLSRQLQTRATFAQFLEWAAHRSIYQLKEADPHSWALPRLGGRAKAALVEIQVDEYGGGQLERMHSELYRQLLRGVGLDDSYGAYVDAVPGITLAISNVMSLFGLRRELRGALAGHLAAYEMTSSAPCRRYGKALRRLGGDEAACAFFDEHVTADALHEQLAVHDLCGALAEDEGLGEDVVFGAAACLHVDRLFAEHVLACWGARRSSLRRPLPSSGAAVRAAS